MKRRDVLRAALGAPFFAAACDARTSSSRGAGHGPDGELLDPGMALGHTLRDVAPPPPQPPSERAAVVVVGAGIAGLACAYRLQKRGVADVRILEIADVAGGTARGGKSAITGFPWGAHYITAPMRENVDLVAFLHEIGALEEADPNNSPAPDDPRDDPRDPEPVEEVACRTPEERVFYRGRFYDGLYLVEGASNDDNAQLARFKREIGAYADMKDAKGRRAFAIPRAHASSDADLLALDRMSFGEWLNARGFTSWRLRWLCDYACRDDYGLALDVTSAWAGLSYFAARRRSSRSAERPVMTWPNGNGALVERLLALCGARVDVEQAAVHIVAAPDDHVDVVVRDRAGAHHTLRAQHVVVAAPRFVASRIVEPLRGQSGSVSAPAAFETTPWVVVNVHLREHPVSAGAPLSWDTVFVESRSLGYVTATHQRGADVGPTVLTWYLPLVDDTPKAAREKLYALGRADWAEAAISELAVAHQGVRDLVTRVDVCRWGHAMTRPTVGLFSSGALAQAERSIGNIHFAHTELSGLALFEEAFFHGHRAADAVCAALAAPAAPARVRPR